MFFGGKLYAHKQRYKEKIRCGTYIQWNIYLNMKIMDDIKIVILREQDGGGVGEHRVHLSPWIQQEYTFRHRSACRTPAENR